MTARQRADLPANQVTAAKSFWTGGLANDEAIVGPVFLREVRTLIR